MLLCAQVGTAIIVSDAGYEILVVFPKSRIGKSAWMRVTDLTMMNIEEREFHGVSPNR